MSIDRLQLFLWKISVLLGSFLAQLAQYVLRDMNHKYRQWDVD